VAESTGRKELQRRLDQLAAEPCDPLTKKRLNQLVEDLEDQLRLPKVAIMLRRCGKGQCPSWTKLSSPDAQPGGPLCPSERTSPDRLLRSEKCRYSCRSLFAVLIEIFPSRRRGFRIKM
jgi:hypothetical protein